MKAAARIKIPSMLKTSPTEENRFRQNPQNNITEPFRMTHKPITVSQVSQSMGAYTGELRYLPRSNYMPKSLCEPLTAGKGTPFVKIHSPEKLPAFLVYLNIVAIQCGFRNSFLPR
jgi:hypothetical protein